MESHEAKASTSTCGWLSHDLGVFDMPEPFEVVSEFLISQCVIETAHKHFIPHPLSLKSFKFPRLSLHIVPSITVSLISVIIPSRSCLIILITTPSIVVGVIGTMGLLLLHGRRLTHAKV